ncbi:MAG: cytochrome c biogenesis protein ResB [Microbacteriaceae bacterium]|nr:cytochrome c biogenesis protein ResB [Microbacteriaceae bacterium]
MEPLRPSDFDDGTPAPAPQMPALGVAGWGRFVWRQLTSMRTALFLLLLLAIAAIPGSLVPQRSSDPNGVLAWKRDDPELFEILDRFQLFDTFSSIWFSSIYLLLFISLIGCILPRTQHHLKALRQPPPAIPQRLERLEHFERKEVPGDPAGLTALAETVVKQRGYRLAREEDGVSGERGYLRETANLVFHFALVGILVALGLGTGYKYQGQRVIIEGQTFTNQLTSYDTFNPGRFFSESSLEPYSLTLRSFTPTYQFDVTTGRTNPLDFAAAIGVTEPDSLSETLLRVNEPLDVQGTSVYLLGNGFAPWITVTSSSGEVVFSQPVPFLPQDANLTSLGVVKIPDGLEIQLGMIGFFYPSAIELDTGALTSVYPEPDKPVLTLNVFEGDLGLNEGIPRNVYSLDTSSLTQITGGDTGQDSLVLALGEKAELPGGRASVEFSELRRFISVDIHRDPTQIPVALCAGLIMLGLVVSLFITRRRVWIRVVGTKGPTSTVEFAALARGDDPGLARELKDLVANFSQEAESRMKQR